MRMPDLGLGEFGDQESRRASRFQEKSVLNVAGMALILTVILEIAAFEGKYSFYLTLLAAILNFSAVLLFLGWRSVKGWACAVGVVAVVIGVMLIGLFLA